MTRVEMGSVKREGLQKGFKESGSGQSALRRVRQDRVGCCGVNYASTDVDCIVVGGGL